MDDGIHVCSIFPRSFSSLLSTTLPHFLFKPGTCPRVATPRNPEMHPARQVADRNQGFKIWLILVENNNIYRELFDNSDGLLRKFTSSFFFGIEQFC